MPSTIEQAKEAILKRGGRASKHQIAQELKISSDYASLILGELYRKKEVAFSGGLYVLTSDKRGVNPEKAQKSVIIPPVKQTVRRLKKSKGTKSIKKSKIKKDLPHPLVGALEISKSLARILEKAGYTTIE